MFNPAPKPEKKDKNRKDLVCKCGSKQVVNKTYSLCYDCNQARLKGKDWKQDKIKHSKELLDKKVSNYHKLEKVPKKRLKSIYKGNKYKCSDGNLITQSQINSRYAQVCQLIDLAREPVCESCGRGDKPLSHSHTISRKRLKELGLSDLIYDEVGLILECYEEPTSNPTACHNIWEVAPLKEKMKLKTWEQKLAYIKEYDQETYKKIVFELENI